MAGEVEITSFTCYLLFLFVIRCLVHFVSAR